MGVIGTVTFNWQEYRTNYNAAGTGYTITSYKELKWTRGAHPGYDLRVGYGSLELETHTITSALFFDWVEGRAVQPNWVNHDAQDDPLQRVGEIREPTFVEFTSAAGAATDMSAAYNETVIGLGGNPDGVVTVSETWHAPRTVNP